MDKDKLVGKYIGPNKIKDVSLLDRKTYLGGNVVKVRYKNKKKAEYPEEMVEKIALDKETDLTTLRDTFVKSVVEKMIVVLLESEIQIIDIEYALTKVSSSLNIHLDKANEILWGKEMTKRTLADINKILIKKESKNKAS